MKQKITVLVEVTLDYDNPELRGLLDIRMAEVGKTAEQIRSEAEEAFFEGIKELIDEEFTIPDFPGFSYTVENMTA